MPGFLAGRSPRNKGVRYPADPPKVEEIIGVMRAAVAGLGEARAIAIRAQGSTQSPAPWSVGARPEVFGR